MTVSRSSVISWVQFENNLCKNTITKEDYHFISFGNFKLSPVIHHQVLTDLSVYLQHVHLIILFDFLCCSFILWKLMWVSKWLILVSFLKSDCNLIELGGVGTLFIVNGSDVKAPTKNDTHF